MIVSKRRSDSQRLSAVPARNRVTNSQAVCDGAWSQGSGATLRSIQASEYPATTRIVASMAKAQSNLVPGHVAGLKMLIRPAVSKVRHRMLRAARGRNGPRGSAHPIEHRVDRAVAFSDVERVLDGAADECFGGLHRLQRPLAFGKSRGDRGRERAAAAMRVLRLKAVASQLDHVLAVPVDVDGLLIRVRVTALDDRDVRPERNQVARRLAPIVERSEGSAEQHLGLGKVGVTTSARGS